MEKFSGHNLRSPGLNHVRQSPERDSKPGFFLHLYSVDHCIDVSININLHKLEVNRMVHMSFCYSQIMLI
jgi:hypothetical protein